MSDQYYNRGESDQSAFVQPANLPEGNPGFPQKGSAAAGQNQWSPSQNQGQGQRDPLDGPLDQVRQHIESQIHQAIDQYANRIPGGSAFSQQAKQAASGILDGLERQADSQVDSRLGNLPGMGGKYDNSQNKPGGML